MPRRRKKDGAMRTQIPVVPWLAGVALVMIVAPPLRAADAFPDVLKTKRLVALDLAASGARIVVLNPGLLLGPGDLHLSSTRFVHHFLRGETATRWAA